MKKLLILIALGCFQNLQAQVDFNNYVTLQSKGPIPKDFATQTHLKLEEDLKTDREGLSKSEEAKFLDIIHYGIDNMLHSGVCVYGDEVSTYVSDIAKNLLKDQPEVFSKLRFYTLKSNMANAFSTDQGIVFVTTGLISQFSNEAQLAYVLAHEISHYTENHVVQGFDWKLKNRRHQDFIDEMSTYSKDKEFEADKLAVALCHKAGYSDDELFNSFDVLMYSYLPFDEIELPKNYFNTTDFYIPENLFPKEKYKIKAEDDYDDSQSSHPNIKKRKEAVNDELNKFTDWKTARFVVDEKRFYEVRNICRFENVRTDVIEGSFGNALYSIYLLEREFPESINLARMKAHCWSGLMNFKDNGNINQAINSTSQLEGEGAAMHYLLKKLDKKSLHSLALRTVHDAKKRNPEDKELSLLYDQIVTELASNPNFKREEYSKSGFHQASKDFIALQDSLKNVDTTLQVVAEEGTKKTSKYDRIKRKKDPNVIESFDSTNYCFYGLYDILEDVGFKQQFDQEKEKTRLEEEEETRISKLSLSERKKIRIKQEKEAAQLGIKELIVVEPTVASYNSLGINNAKSEELESDLSEAIHYVGKEFETGLYDINKRTMEQGGTNAFNERSTIMTYLYQVMVADNDEISVIPVDYQLMQDVENNYGTTNVLFTLVEHSYRPRINPGAVVGFIFLPPVLPVYLLNGFLSANRTEITFIVLDLEKGRASYARTAYQNTPVKKWNLRSQMHNFFKEITSTPKK